MYAHLIPCVQPSRLLKFDIVYFVLTIIIIRSSLFVRMSERETDLRVQLKV